MSTKLDQLIEELNVFLNKACFIHGVEKVKRLLEEVEQERSSEKVNEVNNVS